MVRQSKTGLAVGHPPYEGEQARREFKLLLVRRQTPFSFSSPPPGGASECPAVHSLILFMPRPQTKLYFFLPPPSILHPHTTRRTRICTCRPAEPAACSLLSFSTDAMNSSASPARGGGGCSRAIHPRCLLPLPAFGIPSFLNLKRNEQCGPLVFVLHLSHASLFALVYFFSRQARVGVARDWWRAGYHLRINFSRVFEVAHPIFR